MSSSKLTKQAIRQLSHMAERYGLTLDAERIAGLPARIFTKYGGAQVLQKILRDASIATVQCGADGKWLAVIPLDTLLGFIADAKQLERISHRQAAPVE